MRSAQLHSFPTRSWKKVFCRASASKQRSMVRTDVLNDWKTLVVKSSTFKKMAASSSKEAVSMVARHLALAAMSVVSTVFEVACPRIASYLASLSWT